MPGLIASKLDEIMGGLAPIATIFSARTIVDANFDLTAIFNLLMLSLGERHRGSNEMGIWSHGF
jgi:hypothetical protein